MKLTLSIIEWTGWVIIGVCWVLFTLINVVCDFGHWLANVSGEKKIIRGK